MKAEGAAGSPPDSGRAALAWLARAKLRGAVRRQWRRLREPKHLFFALLGLLLIALWLGFALTGFLRGGSGVVGSVEVLVLARLVAMGLLTVTLLGGLAAPGLLLAKDEVERLLSAPISQRELLRFRLRRQFLASSPGLVIFALLFAPRAPSPASAVLGTALIVLSIVLVSQAASLVAAALRRRLPTRAFQILLMLLAAVMGGVVAMWLGTSGPPITEAADSGRGWWDHPLLLLAALPVEPLVRVIAAPDLLGAVPWAALTAVGLAGLYAAILAWPLDLREAVLDTSLRMARAQAAIARGRWGLGTSSRAAQRRPAPWWFGRGPAGALVWHKSTGLLRRSRGSLLLAGLVFVGLAVFGAWTMRMLGMEEDPNQRMLGTLGASGTLVFFGALYFCGMLRCDLREEFERLAQIKAYPLGFRWIFGALLVPQWALASLALVGLIAFNLLWMPEAWPALLPAAALVPLLIAFWLGLDNTFFLVWPTRLVPGAAGSLQQVGRTAVLYMLRGLALFGMFLAVALVVVPIVIALEGALPVPALLLVCGAAATVPLLAGTALIWWLGGRALANFDPARDLG